MATHAKLIVPWNKKHQYWKNSETEQMFQFSANFKLRKTNLALDIKKYFDEFRNALLINKYFQNESNSHFLWFFRIIYGNTDRRARRVARKSELSPSSGFEIIHQIQCPASTRMADQLGLKQKIDKPKNFNRSILIFCDEKWIIH